MTDEIIHVLSDKQKKTNTTSKEAQLSNNHREYTNIHVNDYPSVYMTLWQPPEEQ